MSCVLQTVIQSDVQELNRILFAAIERSLIGTSASNLVDAFYKGTTVNQVCSSWRNFCFIIFFMKTKTAPVKMFCFFLIKKVIVKYTGIVKYSNIK